MLTQVFRSYRESLAIPYDSIETKRQKKNKNALLENYSTKVVHTLLNILSNQDLYKGEYIISDDWLNEILMKKKIQVKMKIKN
jgi:hypothetical protein